MKVVSVFIPTCRQRNARENLQGCWFARPRRKMCCYLMVGVLFYREIKLWLIDWLVDWFGIHSSLQKTDVVEFFMFIALILDVRVGKWSLAKLRKLFNNFLKLLAETRQELWRKYWYTRVGILNQEGGLEAIVLGEYLLRLILSARVVTAPSSFFLTSYKGLLSQLALLLMQTA